MRVIIVMLSSLLTATAVAALVLSVLGWRRVRAPLLAAGAVAFLGARVVVVGWYLGTDRYVERHSVSPHVLLERVVPRVSQGLALLGVGLLVAGLVQYLRRTRRPYAVPVGPSASTTASKFGAH